MSRSKAEADEASRVAARLPRGLNDRGPDELRLQARMLDRIRAVYERYGFEPVETPAFEYTEALGKFLPDQDRPGEGVFSFQDDDGQWLSLRYDLTAPLARYVAQNYDRLPKPYRSYRAGYVFRNEKPGPGRFRQFMQFDADTVGAASVAADAEMCMMAADTMEALGIPRGQYVIRVNNRKVLDGVMETIGLGGADKAGQRLTVLRAIDKLDRLGADGVRQLLGPGRKDESGDFTKGAGLDKKQIGKLLDIVGGASGAWVSYKEGAQLPTDDEEIKLGAELFEGKTNSSSDLNKKFFPDQEGLIRIWLDHIGSSPIGLEGLTELSEMVILFRKAGYGSKRIQVSSSVVRGLEYYTGPVYEAELLFETVNEKGETARFGSVGGGGRYDGLVGRFRGEDIPATGYSIGVSRLQAALSALGRLEAEEQPGPVVVLVMERQRIAEYQRLVAELRAAGIAAEMYLGDSGMRAQMKYADRRGAPAVVIQGSEERERGEVTIKDLAEGARLAATIEDHKTWREARPAQVCVPQAQMVAEIRRILSAG